MNRQSRKWNRSATRCLAILIAALWVEPLVAGGNLEEIDITNVDESPIPGEVIADVQGIRWDDR
jgi:hypothetical protein